MRTALFFEKMAGPTGIEPMTYCLGGSRSIQLSYGSACTNISLSRLPRLAQYFLQNFSAFRLRSPVPDGAPAAYSLMLAVFCFPPSEKVISSAASASARPFMYAPICSTPTWAVL